MSKMMYGSLAINIAVLVPICAGILWQRPWIAESYGSATPARGILAAVYLSILIVSVVLLFIRRPQMVAALLLVQIVYKLMTPFTVGTLANPVVISNLGIAAFHTATLTMFMLRLQTME